MKVEKFQKHYNKPVVINKQYGIDNINTNTHKMKIKEMEIELSYNDDLFISNWIRNNKIILDCFDSN